MLEVLKNNLEDSLLFSILLSYIYNYNYVYVYNYNYIYNSIMVRVHCTGFYSFPAQFVIRTVLCDFAEVLFHMDV